MMNMIFLYNVKVLFNDIFSVCSRDSENEKNLHICLIIKKLVINLNTITYLVQEANDNYPQNFPINSNILYIPFLLS